MISKEKRFFPKKALLFSLVLIGISLLLYDSLLKEFYLKAFPLQFGIVALMTVFSHLKLMNASERNLRKFSTTYLSIMSVRLLICLVFILALFVNRPNQCGQFCRYIFSAFIWLSQFLRSSNFRIFSKKSKFFKLKKLILSHKKSEMLKVFRIMINSLCSRYVLYSDCQSTRTCNCRYQPIGEKFNASKLIMEHIADSYEWHIAKFGETHVSLPLPVNLYSSQTGFHFFISNKFHHGTESFSGLSYCRGRIQI